MNTPETTSRGRPIVWWTRVMGGPLRSHFPAPDQDADDDLCALLEAAERRLARQDSRPER